MSAPDAPHESCAPTLSEPHHGVRNGRSMLEVCVCVCVWISGNRHGRPSGHYRFALGVFVVGVYLDAMVGRRGKVNLSVVATMPKQEHAKMPRSRGNVQFVSTCMPPRSTHHGRTPLCGHGMASMVIALLPNRRPQPATPLQLELCAGEGGKACRWFSRAVIASLWIVDHRVSSQGWSIIARRRLVGRMPLAILLAPNRPSGALLLRRLLFLRRRFT